MSDIAFVIASLIEAVIYSVGFFLIWTIFIWIFCQPMQR